MLADRRKIARVSAGLLSAGLLLALAACPRPKGDPDKSNKHLDIAKDALAKGDLDQAGVESQRAIAVWPGNDEAYVVDGLIHTLRAAGMQRLLEVDDCMTGVDAEAMRQDRDSQLGSADQSFAKAASISPDYGEAWANRGVVATLQESPDHAIEYLQKALLYPARLQNAALTRANLGWAYFHKSNYVEAAKQLLEALQFQPGMCVATYRLGRVYFAREEWEKAAEQFQDVTDQPACGSQEASLFLMKTRIAQGLVDEAKLVRDACIHMAPKSCIAAECRTALDGAEKQP